MASRKLKAWENPGSPERKIHSSHGCLPGSLWRKSSHLEALLSLGLQVAQAGVGAAGKSWGKVKTEEKELSAPGTESLAETE